MLYVIAAEKWFSVPSILSMRDVVRQNLKERNKERERERETMQKT